MALRNIINSIQTSTSSKRETMGKESQAAESKANVFYRLIQPAQDQLRSTENYQQHRSRSANNLQNANDRHSSASSTVSSSVQIRTSSPISTSSSSSSGPANSIISPTKFMSAVHQSRSSMRRPNVNKGANYQFMSNPYSVASLQQQPPAQYMSIKELAFEKLRRQDSARAIEEMASSVDAGQPLLRSAGKLQIAAYNNAGLLTLHVIQGQHYRKLTSGQDSALMYERITPCDSYVTVTTLPDTNDRIMCQTRVYKDSKAPFYDDKFSFEFDSLNDVNNRLVISVWKSNKSAKRLATGQRSATTKSPNELLNALDNNDDLIGCFSFKIKHLLAKGPITPDWFHLLPFHYGIQKHLRCKNDEKAPTETSDSNKITGLNKDLKGLANLNLIIERHPNFEGFGFTVKGSCPCMVTKVESEKPAFSGGLREGDFISKINGVNVSRATCETVVKMIKSSKQRLSLEVCREKQHSQKARPAPRPTNYLYPIAVQQNHIVDNRQRWIHTDPNSTSSTVSSNEAHCLNPQHQVYADDRLFQQTNGYEMVQGKNHFTKMSNSNQTSSSQSSSGVSSAYENIDKYDDYENYEQLLCVRPCSVDQSNVSLSERPRTSNQSAIYGINSSENLPQIKLNNYQSQQQLFYGLESVPEEDENCSGNFSLRAQLIKQGLIEHNNGDLLMDDDEENGVEDELNMDLVPPAHLTPMQSTDNAYGLAESGIRYVDATTDEDDEYQAVRTGSHAEMADEAEQMRRVSMQYYGRCSNMMTWRNQLRQQQP